METKELIDKLAEAYIILSKESRRALLTLRHKGSAEVVKSSKKDYFQKVRQKIDQKLGYCSVTFSITSKKRRFDGVEIEASQKLLIDVWILGQYRHVEVDGHRKKIRVIETFEYGY